MPASAATDARLAIAPPPNFAIAGMANRARSAIEVTLTCHAAPQVSTSAPAIPSSRPNTPTLLISAPSAPSSPSAAPTMRSHVARPVTSPTTWRTAASLLLATSSTVAVRADSLRSTSTRSNRSRARSAAIARPLPIPGPRDPAPVTIAVGRDADAVNGCSRVQYRSDIVRQHRHLASRRVTIGHNATVNASSSLLSR